MPCLVIISGAPASGKTTLSKRLAPEISIPLIAKDDIKEMLFDHLPQFDREWSTIEGRMAMGMMYAGAETLLRTGYHVMIESSFNRSIAVEEINALVQRTGADLIEVHCQLDDELRQQRWTERTQHGNRHAGHLDQPHSRMVHRPEHGPLYPERAHVVDTGAPEEAYERKYATVLAALQTMLGEGGRYEAIDRGV